jgi:restriction system protein
MQWKMSEHSLFAILLRNPWWISAGIAAAIAALALALLREDWRIYGVFSTLPFVAIAAMAAWKQRHLPSGARVASTLEAVRAMSWRDFAAALEEGFRRDGYEVTQVNIAAADFEIAKAGRRALVSAKRWKVARMGVEPLRALVGAKDASDAHECICVVAGELTGNAREFAVKEKVRLIGGAELARMLPNAARGERKSIRAA